MPMRISNMIERNVYDRKLPAVNAAQNAKVDVFKDTTQSIEGIEIVARYIFNAGTANVYFRYGEDVDATSNFNGWIVAGQQLNVETRERVSCMCPTAALFLALTELRREDLMQPGKNILGTGQPNP